MRRVDHERNAVSVPMRRPQGRSAPSYKAGLHARPEPAQGPLPIARPNGPEPAPSPAPKRRGWAHTTGRHTHAQAGPLVNNGSAAKGATTQGAPPGAHIMGRQDRRLDSAHATPLRNPGRSSPAPPQGSNEQGLQQFRGHTMQLRPPVRVAPLHHREYRSGGSGRHHLTKGLQPPTAMRFSEQPSRWSAFSRRHTTDTSCTKPAKRKHRRRIKTEETAKIVASVWGAEFIQFLVVLTVLQWTI